MKNMIKKVKEGREEKDVIGDFECDVCGRKFTTGAKKDDLDRDSGDGTQESFLWQSRQLTKGVFWRSNEYPDKDLSLGAHTIVSLVPVFSHDDDLTLDVCPQCFRDHIEPLRGLYKGRV